MTAGKSKNKPKISFWLPAIIGVAAFIVFFNSLNGEFVYDDKRQVVRNPLIQKSELYGKALSSDVWAFKGDGTIAASNYWRPTFTTWSIFNYQLFGLDSFGWHILNVLLHAAVCLLAFFLLRRWGLNENLAFVISLVFAVHPVHTESVAWIAGSPDLLFSVFFLASLWFFQNYSEKQGRLDNVLALVFYALALGSKEVALLCLPIFWLIFSRGVEDEEKNTASGSISAKLVPFILIAVVYFLLRLKIIGQLSIPAEDASGFLSAILTAPLIFLFYIKQIILPLSLGPNYPIRAIESFSAFGFVVPLLVSAVVAYLFWLLAKRSFLQKIGLALFLLPLLPAFNIPAFVPEQIAHDRYLYLPLLGVLLLILPFVYEMLEKFTKENTVKVFVGIWCFIAVLLAIKTYSYNEYWKSDLALWKHSITIDSNSAFNYSQLGAILTKSKKTAEAIKAYNASIDIKPTSLAYMGRARNLLAKNKIKDAISDLKLVAEMPGEKTNAYTLYQTYEGLAIAHSQEKDLVEAEKALVEGRKRLPIYYAALTAKLAVVLYQKGEKKKALAELDKVQNQARVELLPESKLVFFRLGSLYFESGEKEKAKVALREYLRLTNTFQDKLTLDSRKQTNKLLQR